MFWLNFHFELWSCMIFREKFIPCLDGSIGNQRGLRLHVLTSLLLINKMAVLTQWVWFLIYFCALFWNECGFCCACFSVCYRMIFYCCVVTLENFMVVLVIINQCLFVLANELKMGKVRMVRWIGLDCNRAHALKILFFEMSICSLFAEKFLNLNIFLWKPC